MQDLQIYVCSFIWIRFEYYNKLLQISMHEVHHLPIEQQIITKNVVVQEKGQAQYYPINYYEIGKYLGRCSLGNCYEVRKYRGASMENLGVPLIMKVIRNTDSQLARSVYQNQVRTLEYLKDKNVHVFVKCVRHWAHQGTYYILFEKCRYGSLKTLIEYLKSKGEKLDQAETLYLLREVLKALSQLHKNDVIHGNLKPENIIIGDNLDIKIMDYSLSQITKYQQSLISDNCGTIRYMAPQLFVQDGRTCSKKGDIWAIGIILYYLIQQKQPFENSSIGKFKKKLIKKQFELKVPSELNELLQKMVNKDPNQREQASKLLENVLFKKFTDQDSIKNGLTKRLNACINEISSQIQVWKRKPDNTCILFQEKISNIVRRQQYEKVTVSQIIHEQEYGYFILLSNLSVVGYFNNGKILNLQKQMLFSPNSNEERILVRAYRTYFSSIIKEGHRNQFTQMSCTLKKLIVVNGNIFVRLSNNVFQVFFNQKDAKDKSYTFLKSACLNYHKTNHLLSIFKEKQEIFYYQNLQKALQSKHQSYFEYIKQVFSTILEGSNMRKTFPK